MHKHLILNKIKFKKKKPWSSNVPIGELDFLNLANFPSQLSRTQYISMQSAEK